MGTVRSLPLFAGFCYTQFTDTYQEANGLLYMDRTPKFPLDQIAVATRARNDEERAVEARLQAGGGEGRGEVKRRSARRDNWIPASWTSRTV